MDNMAELDEAFLSRVTDGMNLPRTGYGYAAVHQAQDVATFTQIQSYMLTAHGMDKG